MSCQCETSGSCESCKDKLANGLPECDYVAPEIKTPYPCSLAVQLQEVVDMGRMINYELGLNAYRCFLVWQERDSKQRFKEVKRIELMPCKVKLTSEFTRIQWKLTGAGARPEGMIQLEEISPRQVTEADLRGRLDGKDLPDGMEFFYEVIQEARCAGEDPKIWRYTLNSVPFFVAEKFMYVVDLADQVAPRGSELLEDRDQAHRPAKEKKGSAIKF